MTAVKRGEVMAQVEVELAGTTHRMASVMVGDALEVPVLEQGDLVHGLAEAVNVLPVAVAAAQGSHGRGREACPPLRRIGHPAVIGLA